MAVSTPRGISHVQPLNALNYDPFERGLLRVTRYIFLGCEDAGSLGWQKAVTVAIERWGDRVGYPVAHLLSKVVTAVLRARTDGISIHDPFDLNARNEITDDEVYFMDMLHHMRRDNVDKARNSVELLTGGRMDPDVIRAGLELSHRFASGPTASPMPKNVAPLHLVS
ncbi:MAG: hypothetical protein AAGA12_12040 [Pseudomonadota bacterium]